jgi:Tfp pilus assembly protein PilW
MSLVKLLVATGLGALLLAAGGMLSIYGTRTFATIGNYSDLEAKSRNALDVVSSQLRQTTAVITCRTNLPVKSLALQTAGDDGGVVTVELAWDADARTFEIKTGEQKQILLTECDEWDFALFNRAPNLGPDDISFNEATDLKDCKLINMSWRCSRMMSGKTNAESVQALQVVLRNKLR